MTGRVVLITGAGSGIGKQCARTLAAAGASVALVDLNGDAASQVADELRAEGSIVADWAADVTDAEQLSIVTDEASARLGTVDGLVASAGIYRSTAFLDIDSTEWRTVVQTNLEGTFVAVQQVGRRLLEAGTPGSIVLISSVAGRSARPDNAHYAASKAGVVSLVQSAAAALAPLVRVNGLCPGSVDTPMLNRHLGSRDGTATARACLLQRTGQPADIAAAVTFLLSDRASFITGQSLNVDGGAVFN